MTHRAILEELRDAFKRWRDGERRRQDDDPDGDHSWSAGAEFAYKIAEGSMVAVLKSLPRWEKGWPTQPGRYWFHDARNTSGKPRIDIVMVRCASNGLVCMTDAEILWQSEYDTDAVYHMWLEVPALPGKE